MKIKAVIITGSAQYEKQINPSAFNRPIWKLTVETMKQLDSEQYILQKGFKRVENP
jgi:hypothetical protein